MGETKKCKHCQTEIDKKAKICPNCKKKQGSKAPLIIAIVLVVFIIIGASQSGKDEPKAVDASNNTAKTSDTDKKDNKTDSKADDKKDTATPAPEKTSFKVGEAVELKDILVKLTDVKEVEGSEFNKPTDGNVFVLCEFNIENNSKKEITVSSVMSFEAYCDDYSMQQSFGALLENKNVKQLDGTVAPGKKMNGAIGYEVPKDWKKIEINYTPDFWSGKDIKFIATK